ncbi:MAG: hypothetical protein QM496_11020 [Verrucomicrobiota bacterium]
MSIIGGILMAIGGIIMVIFSIIIIIKAFKTSIWWGLGSLFVPFVSLVFVIMNWPMCKKPFLSMLGGALIYGIGTAMLMPTLMKNAQEQIENAQQQMEQQGQATPTP